ncbi:hypothetical protein RAN53_09385 [Halomonas sp. SSL-5]|uniref:hypothetical protein n=1 Tax=Halomonas sp. SSL-5 TaxID=3065855 RepID=UPI0027387B88|nr:hypothetical protein [Halomonas sp. SSL-5]MDY7116562.1 hypothetical protein [Halomonas sp. SSL-5]
MKNADMPAMPSGIREDYNNLAQEPLNLGLTKREFFAAMAMQGLLACPGVSATNRHIAIESVDCADELLAALGKPK